MENRGMFTPDEITIHKTPPSSLRVLNLWTIGGSPKCLVFNGKSMKILFRWMIWGTRSHILGNLHIGSLWVPLFWSLQDAPGGISSLKLNTLAWMIKPWNHIFKQGRAVTEYIICHVGQFHANPTVGDPFYRDPGLKRCSFLSMSWCHAAAPKYLSPRNGGDVEAPNVALRCRKGSSSGTARPRKPKPTTKSGGLGPNDCLAWCCRLYDPLRLTSLGDRVRGMSQLVKMTQLRPRLCWGPWVYLGPMLGPS